MKSFIVMSLFLSTVASSALADVKDITWTCWNGDNSKKATLTANLELAPGSRVALESTELTYQESDVLSLTYTFEESEIFDSSADAADSIEKEYGAAYGKLIPGYLKNGLQYSKASMIFSGVRRQLVIYDFETQEEHVFGSCTR